MNVITTRNVLLDVNVLLNVYFTLHSTVRGVTALLVPVMAVVIGGIAASTSMTIHHKMLG
nr:hypothetical protein [uncultured Lachnoanaerobaculum sp.]